MKKLSYFIKNYYLLLAFFLLISLVGIIYLNKKLSNHSSSIFIKVKVGQGLWWASTGKPSLWLIRSIKERISNDSKSDNAKIISVNYCPLFLNSINNQYSNNQFDTYVVLNLPVNLLNQNQYVYKGERIDIGGPIDIELPGLQFSGTITEINNEQIKEIFIRKTVYLKKTAASINEFENIKINDEYFDGSKNIFKIIDKSILGDTVTIKSEVMVKEQGNQMVYCEEEILTNNKIMSFMTPNSILLNYSVERVE